MPGYLVTIIIDRTANLIVNIIGGIAYILGINRDFQFPLEIIVITLRKFSNKLELIDQIIDKPDKFNT